jgi:rRNA-processing protein EBP2
MEVATQEDEQSLMSDEEENIKEDRRILQEEERAGQVPIEECVYDEKGMMQKLEEIKLVIPGKEEVPWIETLALSTEKFELEKKGDDLEREKGFYNSALKGALEGLAILKQLEVPIDRPDDYFAEMIKTDNHMAKVKSSLLQETRKIKESQDRTRKRIEQKYLKNSQNLQHAERAKEKQEEQEAIRKWRRLKRKNNMEEEEFPEELLDPNSQLRKQLSGNRSKNKRLPLSNAKKKAKKYGAGKRVNKRNTAQSTNDTSEWSVARNKSSSFSFKTKKKKPQQNRPGKRSRQQARSSKSNSSKKPRKN